jgi:hypothetical protein
MKSRKVQAESAGEKTRGRNKWQEAIVRQLKKTLDFGKAAYHNKASYKADGFSNKQNEEAQMSKANEVPDTDMI